MTKRMKGEFRHVLALLLEELSCRATLKDESTIAITVLGERTQ